MTDVTLTSEVERKREQGRLRVQRLRERQKTAAGAKPPLLFETQDWQLFLRPATLSQKAGCAPSQIGRIVLKEIVDNALDDDPSNAVLIDELRDDGGKVTGYRVTDGGTGMDPADIPILFAVNRPLLSSKLKRLPLRGMLGNGLRVVMGAVAAYDGTIAVTSHGHRLELEVDKITGKTGVVSDGLTRPVDGTVVEITLPNFDGTESPPADLSLAVAQSGTHYTGPSQPSWYGPEDLRAMFNAVQPPTTTVGEVVAEVFDLAVEDDRIAASLDADEVAALHAALRAHVRRVAPIGHIGNGNQWDVRIPTYLGKDYSLVSGVAKIGGHAEVPFTVECWAECWHAERRESTDRAVQLLLNRSPCVTPLWVRGDGDGLWLRECGLDYTITGKRAHYALSVSLITPYVLLMSDGKTPFLGDFGEAIYRAVQKAAGSAYRAMIRPASKMSRRAAAWQVMPEAYMAASAQNTLPANARQVMYPARGPILRLAGVAKFNPNDFTQHWLPDYQNAHVEETADWNVVYDGRGHFLEPHTGRQILLSTLGVRRYIGTRPELGPAVDFAINVMYPTTGPENRYRDALFIEKEGFDALIAAARIAERFDIAPFSTKGMSTTACRELVDWLTARGVRIFALHDFDISGFTIKGTLGTDSRRYVFKNMPNVVDLGLRLKDVEGLRLESEPVALGKRRREDEDEDEDEDKVEAKLDKIAATLERHGAEEDEIYFLLGWDGNGTKRVELNAMTSDVFVAFLERKLTLAGVTKLIPSGKVQREQWQRLHEQQLADAVLKAAQPDIVRQAALNKPPRDLGARIKKVLAERPELSWDQAMAVVGGIA